MKHILTNRWLVALAVSLTFFSCKDEEPDAQVVASFQFQADAEDFRKVQFTNFSQNAVSYAWDFGDQTTSTEKDPEHSFPGDGVYTVRLTATAENGSNANFVREITITDPNVAIRALIGDGSKTWKLLRDVSTGVYPLEVGPQSRSEIWFALGLQQQIGERPCMLTDEWIFNESGSMEYRTNGEFWGEFNVISPSVGAPGCLTSTNGNYLNVNGVSVAEWNSGVHGFEYNVGTQKLTVSGLGAFIGLAKVTTDGEATVPQPSVTYSVIRLVDAAVDTLILETNLAAVNGYWRFVLVSYDNPNDEPPIPGTAPLTSFSYEVNGATKTVTFTNTTTGGDSYSWDFGDGNTSTASDPTHTYANDGEYTVVLTATNNVGTTTATDIVGVNVSGTEDVNLTFETVEPAFETFGGSTYAFIDNPHKSGINTSNRVLETVHGSEPWAGLFTELESRMNLTNKKTLKLKVWAPATGDFRLKLENIQNTNEFVEIDRPVTVANQWVELSFDLSQVASNKFARIVIFPGWNVANAGTFYVDDITLVD